MPQRSEFDFVGTERFEIRRRIGAGGMGVVYEAYDRELGARVALKTLKRVDAESLYRLKNEFRGLQDLEHRNLVSLGELFERDGNWFFTMELVEGVELGNWVRPDDADACDERRLRESMSQLATGLVVLHEAGKVHRDIKPSNVLVDSEGRVVLLDFGLIADAIAAPGHNSQARAVGTAAYMAPEQAAAKPIGPEADWYSVGVVLYETLTGQLPFAGPALQVLMDKQHLQPPRPRELRPEVPEDLDELCMSLLAIDPAERPSGRRVIRRLGVDPTPRSNRPSSTSQLTNTPPFVGRSTELAFLERAFERAATRAVAVYIRGESGVGKTALVRHFVDQRAMAGKPPVVLSGRCYQRESVPYKAFDGVIDALSQYLRGIPKTDAATLLPRHVGLIAQVFPVLGRVEVVAQAPRPAHGAMQPNELRTRAFAALRELIGAIADVHRVVVMIDDLHWADSDSLHLLRELVRPPDAPAVLLCATLRPDVPNESDLELPGGVQYLDLGPLDVQPARKLARMLLRQFGVRTNASTGWIAVEARGHPMYIDELVRHIVVSGPSSPPDRMRLDDAIWERVQYLEPGAKHILRLLCVAGGPTPLGAMRDAAELDPQTFSKAVSLLRVANLIRAKGWRDIDRVEPYHDRVREAVVMNIDDAERARCHERLAVAFELSADSIPPEELVYHLEAAGHAERAATHAARGAENARKAFAFRRAAQLYRAALRLGDATGERARALRMGLGDALSFAGRGPEAASVWLEAAEGADAATRLECLQMASQEYLIAGYLDEGFAALGMLLGEIGVSMPKTPRRALASLVWNRARLRLGGRTWRERHEREIADAELIKFDVYRSVSVALGLIDNIRGADFMARGIVHALRTGEPVRVAYALANESIYTAAQGGRGVARGRQLVAEVEAIADRIDNPHVAILYEISSRLSGILNRPIADAVVASAEAERLLDDPRATGPSRALSLVSLRGLMRSFRCIALRTRGQLFELHTVYERYVREAEDRGDRYMETTLRRLCNVVWLAAADSSAAHDNLDRTAWTDRSHGYHLQHAVEDEARIELALYEGRAATQFDELMTRFSAAPRSLWLRIQIFRTLYNYAFARLVIAGRPDDAKYRRRALAKVRALEDEGTGYAAVYSRLARAGLERDRDCATELWRESIALAEEHGLQLCGAAAQLRLAALVGGGKGDALRERAVVTMTREGVADPDGMANVLAPTSL